MASAGNNCSASHPATGEKPLFSVECLRSRAPVKLFVTDLDGTLLFPSLQVSERAIAAFRRLHQLGVQCAIATGRPCGGAITCIGEEVLQRLGLPHGQPGIYMNGSVVIGKAGEKLHLEYITPQQTQQVLAVAEQHGWLPRVCGYGESGIFCLEKDKFTMELYEHYGEAAPQVITREVFQNTLFCKLAVNGSPEDVLKIRQILQLAFEGTDLRPVRPIPCSVEICPAKVSKAEGLRSLLQHLQLQQEEVFAIGDSENDVEMLEFAGVSVAVGNANAVARDAAKFITCRCDEDAVAKAAECVAQILEERQGHKTHAKADAEGGEAAGERERSAGGVGGAVTAAELEEKTGKTKASSRNCSSDEDTDEESEGHLL